MKNRDGLYPPSQETRFYIESDDEQFVHDEEKGNSKDYDSDSSDSSPADSPRQHKPGSYNTSWPQSYRQSIDMYSSVTSPNIGFLGTPSINRISSSYLSSNSLVNRKPSHTAEDFANSVLTKPLLPAKADQSAEETAPPKKIPSRKANILIPSRQASQASLGLPAAAKECTFGQSLMNGMNVLCGVGILTTPYAVKEGGWLGLSVLFVFALLSCYTGVLLRYCLESHPGLETYPDIGQAAFGTPGRVAISIILYMELYACCVEYIILESDNLSALFPNAHIDIAGLHLGAHEFFAIMTAIAVLPTAWLRDLSILSYISVGGVIASILVVISLFWLGVVDNVGFHHKGTALSWTNLPVAVGLYGYCYSGHAVYPNIYSSMKKPSQFTALLIISFAICTIMYASVAVMGYMMFGDLTDNQFTLNMPKTFVASKIAVWTTVVNPFTKYALTITPVALSLEELLPPCTTKYAHSFSITIRTALVISTLILALTIPFFGYIVAFIGSFQTMFIVMIFPCACFLSIVRGKVTWLQVILCIIIIILGTITCIFGTYSSVAGIVDGLHH